MIKVLLLRYNYNYVVTGAVGRLDTSVVLEIYH